MNSYPIRGNTYPIKDSLKQLGCRWNGQEKCWVASTKEIFEKAQALLNNQPAYNSPPPRDLGPVDAKAEAAKLGRVAIADKTVPFQMLCGKGRPTPTGETFWGKNRGVRNRYLVLRSSRPDYLSRERLDDFDKFDQPSGWYCDCDCVAVEPTAEEIANDPVKLAAEKKAREAAEAKKAAEEKAARLALAAPRLREIANIVAKSETHVSTGGSCLLWKGDNGEELRAISIGLFYCSPATDKPQQYGTRALYLEDQALTQEALRLAEEKISYQGC
jgi:hypothetical protein